MALVTWTHTFRDGVAPIKNGAVYVYLAGTTDAAQVWDVNNVLHDSAPQLRTDTTGYVEFKVADDYYSLSQAFDISCVPDPLFNPDAETVYVPGTLILQLSGRLAGEGLIINLNTGRITSDSGSRIVISGGALNLTSGTGTWSGGTISISGTAVTISSTGSLTVTAASGIDIDTGGSLVVTGGSISVTSGSISISSTGAFSMSAGTFSITGGTVSISADGGLTIASGSKITINSTDGIYFSTKGQIFYGADYTHLLATSGNDLYLTGDMVFLDTCTTKSLEPGATTYDIGTSTWHYDDGYFDTLYQKTEAGSAVNHVKSFDHLDDLAIVKRYGESDMIEPFQVLPIECTNIVKLAEEEGISTDDVYKRPDLWNRIFYNPLMVGIFGIGSTKQLYNRVIELERRLS